MAASFAIAWSHHQNINVVKTFNYSFQKKIFIN
jgi:hypothetical protein